MKFKNKILSILLTAAFVLSLVPGITLTAQAADKTYHIDYGYIAIAQNADDSSKLDVTHSATSGATPTIDTIPATYNIVITQTDSGTSVGNYIYIGGSIANTVNITLNHVNIDESSKANTNAIYIAVGTAVNLTLTGDNTLKSGYTSAGIGVPDGAALTVTAASTGTVTATGGNCGAGIGGGDGVSGGTVTINGGTVTANGSDGWGGGAGIGGGCGCSGGTVTINGGTVTANGSDGSGMSIGGGSGMSGGILTVGSANTSQPLPKVTLGKNGTNATTSFKNCVIVNNASAEMTGTYNADGYISQAVGVSTQQKVNIGADAVLTATSSGYAENGTVQFSYSADNGVSFTKIGSPVLVSAGKGSTTFSSATVGNYIIKADYLSANSYRRGSSTTAISVIDTILSSLGTSAGTLDPVLAPGKTDYTVHVDSSVNSVTVTPTAHNSSATVTVNGKTVASGMASDSIPLAAAATTEIKIVVTAQDNSDSTTYKIEVTRASSADSSLMGLTLSTGTLNPVFAPGTTDYAVNAGQVGSITVTPTANDAIAAVTVNGETVASGAASDSISLTAGATTEIDVVVTAKDGSNSTTYKIIVTRAPSTDSSLAGLSVSTGTLSPAFASGTTDYAVNVYSTVPNVTVTPTVGDANATVKVNGTAVASGSESGSISLTPGTSSKINIVVTAQDGITKTTYSVTVTDISPTQAIDANSLQSLKAPTGTNQYQHVYYGGTRWRVLNNSGSQLFLLTDNVVANMAYSSNIQNLNHYNVSDIRTWLLGIFLNGFSNLEQSAMAQNSDCYNDKIFILSSADVHNLTYFRGASVYTQYGLNHVYGAPFAIGTDWWTRWTKEDTSLYVYYFDSDGNDMRFGNVADSKGVRPGMLLNLSSVLHASPAADGADPSVDSALSLTQTVTDNVKLTLLDSAETLAIDSVTADSYKRGSTVTVGYSGASTGTNQYLCVNLAAGVSSYRGVIKALTSGNESGTATFTLPMDVTSGKYTLRLWNEQYNAAECTNYASALENEDITFSTPSITTASLSDGTVEQVYSQTLAATKSPTSWNISSGSLPGGLSIDSSGVISGTPTTPGKFTFSVTASNSAGDSSEQQLTITIKAAPDTIKPTVAGITPSGTNVVTGGSIVITFSEAMSTTTGTVSLDGGSTSLTGGTWSSGSTVYTIAFCGLDYGTQYTITTSDFEDTSGNVMNADNSQKFTTIAMIHVASITIAGAGSKTSVTNGGTLQMSAAVSPDDATDKSVTWSVTNGTGRATIGMTGLLSAAGTGTVTVKATAADGSGVHGEKEITVTNEPANTHTVSVSNDGNGTGSADFSSAAKGTTVTLSSTPSSGYHFKKWQVITPSALSITSNTFTMPDEAVIVKAIFEADAATNRTVTFYNGSTVYAVKTAALNGSIGSTSWPTDPTKSGYTFNGWYTGENGGGSIFTSSSTVTSGITVYAKWSLNSSGSGMSDSSTSDNSSESSTTINITTTDGITTVSAEVKSSTGSDGTGTASVTQKQMQDAVDAAVKEAAAKGTKAVAAFSVDTNDNATGISVSIPQAAIKEAADNGIHALEVTSPQVTVSFDSTALASLNEAAEGAFVVKAVKASDTALFEADKALVGSRPIYVLSITSGSTTISSFGGGKATVSILYTLSAGEDANKIVIYYISGSGKLVMIPNCVYNASTGTVTFMTTHFSTYAVGYNNMSFTDVSGWYTDYVSYLGARGIINGTGNGIFSPDENITRAQFVTILARMSGDYLSGYTASSFSDIATTDWYFAAVQWAYKNGVAAGSGGKFAPGANITREQMAVMLYNYAKYAGADIPNAEGMSVREFSDYASISSWALKPIQWAINNSIISGNSDGSFAPTASATRAQAAKMIALLLQDMIGS